MEETRGGARVATEPTTGRRDVLSRIAAAMGATALAACGGEAAPTAVTRPVERPEAAAPAPTAGVAPTPKPAEPAA